MKYDINSYVETLLDKNKLVLTLSFISLFIAVYEKFTEIIMKNWESFFCYEVTGLDKYGDLKYKETENFKKLRKTKVDENGNNDLLKACLLEFVKLNVMTIEEYDKFAVIKQQRLKYAHETFECILNGISKEDADNFMFMFNLWDKLEKYWINEIEMCGETEEWDKDKVNSLTFIAFSTMIQTLLKDCDKNETFNNIG